MLGSCVGSVGRCCVTFTVVRWGYCTGIPLCKLAVFHLPSSLVITVGVLLWLLSAWCSTVASVSGFLHLA